MGNLNLFDLCVIIIINIINILKLSAKVDRLRILRNTIEELRFFSI